jgi:hypothetical protein
MQQADKEKYTQNSVGYADKDSYLIITSQWNKKRRKFGQKFSLPSIL